MDTLIITLSTALTMLTGTVFVITFLMFLGWTSSDIMSTRLVRKFLIGSRLVLTVSSLAENTRGNLIHYHASLHVVVLLQHIVTIIFISSIGTKFGRIRSSLVLLGIFVKQLKWPNPTMMMQLITMPLGILDHKIFAKCSIPPLFNGPWVLTSSKDKANLFARKFSANFTLNDTMHILPDFPSQTEQKIFTMKITVRMVANAICEHVDKVTCPDIVPSNVLKMCFRVVSCFC